MTKPPGVPGVSQEPAPPRPATAGARASGTKPGVLLGYSVAPKPAVLGAGAPPRAPARPTPVAHKPKGRWFMGTFVLGFLALVAYKVWNAFLRYEAYGIVIGREVEVAAPWIGAVAAVHVLEGERVRQGALLCTLSNLGLLQDRHRLQDELRVAQADLAVELTRLELERALHQDRVALARAEYHEAWSELLEEQARQDVLQQRYERQLRLYESGVISEDALTQLREEAGGQTDKVAELQREVEERRRRSEIGTGAGGEERLRPFELRLRLLEADLERIAERLEQGEVRAPVSGTVVRRACYVGEQASPEKALLTILEEGSERIELYVSQDAADTLTPGVEVELELEPGDEWLRFRVEGLGQAFELPPPNVARFALAGELFLPVQLVPVPEPGQRIELRIGALAKLPRFPS